MNFEPKATLNVGLIANAGEVVRTVCVKKVASIPNVGVFTRAENAARRNLFRRSIATARNDLNTRVILLVN